jgi:hypothetical protein
MEPMCVRVRSVEVNSEVGLAVARVEATSVRKVRGRPVARIELKVAIEAECGEPAVIRKARPRDEALAFLDLA